MTKTLRKMEGALEDTCPGQSVSEDRVQLVVEDLSKAEAFVRTYASISRRTRHRKRDCVVKANLKIARAQSCTRVGQRSEACKPFFKQRTLDRMKRMKAKKRPGQTSFARSTYCIRDPSPRMPCFASSICSGASLRSLPAGGGLSSSRFRRHERTRRTSLATAPSH